MSRYPHAMALKTALRSYAAARGLITTELEPLVAQELRDIKDSITEAFEVSPDGTKLATKRHIRWESNNFDQRIMNKLNRDSNGSGEAMPGDISSSSMNSSSQSLDYFDQRIMNQRNQRKQRRKWRRSYWKS